MKYINRTGITTPIGKIVKLDKDGRGVVLPQSSDTNVLGVVIAVIGGDVEVVSDGTRMTFINGVFKPGDTVYLRKASQSGSLGSCYASATPIAPYVRIGTAIEVGSSRMARVTMGVWAVGESGATGTGVAYSVFSASTSGLVPRPGTSLGRFLKDNGTWAMPPIGAFVDGGGADTEYGGITPIEGGGV